MLYILDIAAIRKDPIASEGDDGKPWNIIYDARWNNPADQLADALGDLTCLATPCGWLAPTQEITKLIRRQSKPWQEIFQKVAQQIAAHPGEIARVQGQAREGNVLILYDNMGLVRLAPYYNPIMYFVYLCHKDNIETINKQTKNTIIDFPEWVEGAYEIQKASR